MCELRLTHITHRYEQADVVEDVSLTVERGRVHVLLGASGVGKTTLLWIAGGLVQPTAGTVREAGVTDDIITTAPARFGMVVQPAGLWPHLTVTQHLRLVLTAQRLSRSQKSEHIGHMLDAIGLTRLAARRPAALSSGEQRRLALARALVVQPRWLLLDEPLTHLDGSARAELLGLLQRVLASTSAGVLLTTHTPDEAMRLGDELLLMAGGRIIQTGTPEQVYLHPRNLQAAKLLGDAEQIEGIIRNGLLHIGDAPVVHNVPLKDGAASLIVRPHELRFTADPEGPATVTHAQCLGRTYRLTVRAADRTFPVDAPQAVPVGTTGQLHLCRRIEDAAD